MGDHAWLHFLVGLRVRIPVIQTTTVLLRRGEWSWSTIRGPQAIEAERPEDGTKRRPSSFARAIGVTLRLHAVAVAVPLRCLHSGNPCRAAIPELN
jgi:hypothetical protein